MRDEKDILSGVVSRVDRAIHSLQNGKIILVDTDTVPGMAVSPFSPGIVDKVYRLKGRREDKPLVWMVSDISLLRDALEIPEYANPLMDRHWPGALTLVFGLRKGAQTQWGGGLTGDSLAVRIPAGDRYLKMLLHRIQEPLAVTSVNRSGCREITDFGEIYREFGEDLDWSLYRDVGKEFLASDQKKKNKSEEKPKQVSTVVDVRGKHPRILRQGKLLIDGERG